MTGFARHSGGLEDFRWTWEIRSVNGKGLDIRFRLPPGFESLDQDVRKLTNALLSRGNLQVSLAIERNQVASHINVNEAALSRVLAAIESVEASTQTEPSTAAQILSLRGVLEISEAQFADENQENARGALLDGFQQTLQLLIEHRKSEGDTLSSILVAHLDAVAELTKQAENDPSHAPEAIREKLFSQIEQLAASDVALDVSRLHQEAALLATKADIREELDRLKAHVEAGKQLVLVGSPAGRKLEFLSQEFNREANTLCSKSNTVSLTAIGLELKSVIDQFREQILNVE